MPIDPTRPDVIHNPEHWRKRGEELRTLAEEMREPFTRSAMLRLAADYDLLAERAAQQASGAQKLDPLWH